MGIITFGMLSRNKNTPDATFPLINVIQNNVFIDLIIPIPNLTRRLQAFYGFLGETEACLTYSVNSKANEIVDGIQSIEGKSSGIHNKLICVN